MSVQPGSSKWKSIPKLIILGLFACWLIFLPGCQLRTVDKQRPKALAGVIDLRNWDFERDGPVKLDGEWRFHWLQFIN